MNSNIAQIPFEVGAGSADITPPVGTLLYGYNPHQVSTSVHDNLNVTSVAFRQGETTVMLFSATVGDFQTELTVELRGIIAEATGIPFENIILSATHTHSAPNVAGFEGWGDVDREFVDSILIPALKKCAAEAISELTPAEVAIGVCRSDVGINRRQHNVDGSISLGQNPWGCYDPNMTVLVFRSKESKKGILNLIHYGCHGTAAGCNEEISRDWSGVMCDSLEKETGTLTAFWNGSIGDVGPRLTNGCTVGDISYVERLGAVAAQDAMRAYEARGAFHDGNLKLYRGTVSLPYKPLPTLDEVREELSHYDNPEKLYNLPALIYNHLISVEKLLTSRETEVFDSLDLPTTIVSIGDAVFIPIPFEFFSGISMRLRTYLADRYPYVLGLSNSNGYYCYLPTEDQLCLGGYEVECFLHSGLYLLQNNTDQHLIDETLRIIGS